MYQDFIDSDKSSILLREQICATAHLFRQNLRKASKRLKKRVRQNSENQFECENDETEKLCIFSEYLQLVSDFIKCNLAEEMHTYLGVKPDRERAQRLDSKEIIQEEAKYDHPLEESVIFEQE